MLTLNGFGMSDESTTVTINDEVVEVLSVNISHVRRTSINQLAHLLISLEQEKADDNFSIRSLNVIWFPVFYVINYQL